MLCGLTIVRTKSLPFAFPEGLSMDIRNVAPLTRILDSFLASGIKTAVDGGTDSLKQIGEQVTFPNMLDEVSASVLDALSKGEK